MTTKANTSRRNLLGGAVTLAAASAAMVANAQTTAPAKPTTKALAPSFTAPATPKPLPFNPAKLDGISEKLMQSHWENNYSGALKALGVVKTRLNDMVMAKDVPPYIYKGRTQKTEKIVR